MKARPLNFINSPWGYAPFFLVLVLIVGCAKKGGDADDVKKPAPAANAPASGKGDAKAADAKPAEDEESGGRVTTEDGEPAVKISLEEMQHNGIVAVKLPAKRWRPAYPAVAFVQELSSLIEAAGLWSEAQTLVAKSDAALFASKAEFDRLHQLNTDQQNISIKDLQTAEAAWRGDTATAQGAQIAVQHRAAVLHQQWGPTISQWITQSTPEYQQLLKGELLLLRLTAPSAPATPPKEARVLAPSGKWEAARFISATVQADAEFQKPSYYFSVPVTSGLLVGMSANALVSADGPEVKGTSVPPSAIVHWQGKSWIYEQTKPELFVRKEVTLDQPDDTGGYFVSDPVLTDPVATYGAQMLLSEEFHPAAAAD